MRYRARGRRYDRPRTDDNGLRRHYWTARTWLDPEGHRWWFMQRKAGLVQETAWEEDARLRVYELRRKPFSDLRDRVVNVEAFWSEQLHALVDVTFDADAHGTLVTVTQRGCSDIPPNHPARHALDVPSFIRMMVMWWEDLLGSMRLHAEQTAQ